MISLGWTTPLNTLLWLCCSVKDEMSCAETCGLLAALVQSSHGLCSLYLGNALGRTENCCCCVCACVHLIKQRWTCLCGRQVRNRAAVHPSSKETAVHPGAMLTKTSIHAKCFKMKTFINSPFLDSPSSLPSRCVCSGFVSPWGKEGGRIWKTRAGKHPASSETQPLKEKNIWD